MKSTSLIYAFSTLHLSDWFSHTALPMQNVGCKSKPFIFIWYSSCIHLPEYIQDHRCLSAHNDKIFAQWNQQVQYFHRLYHHSALLLFFPGTYTQSVKILLSFQADSRLRDHKYPLLEHSKNITFWLVALGLNRQRCVTESQGDEWSAEVTNGGMSASYIRVLRNRPHNSHV